MKESGIMESLMGKEKLSLQQEFISKVGSETENVHAKMDF